MHTVEQLSALLGSDTNQRPASLWAQAAAMSQVSTDRGQPMPDGGIVWEQYHLSSPAASLEGPL